MAKPIEKMGVARLSSKGQLVIPSGIRARASLKEGSMVLVASYGDMVVLKKVGKLVSDEDLESLKRVDEAWEDIEHGRYKTGSLEEFFSQAREW
ncbi:AbrB/MazE/SpoVT family DNA-binding domain-containing protein [Candidatus Woesearchaeota archaeon]|nr:AbrB/MazE/SpoVT family DNA-binding domain-containing protein [Candidatus Woesearchaeota archaeon]